MVLIQAVTLSLWVCTLGHTVYRYPDKVPIPHKHTTEYGHHSQDHDRYSDDQQKSNHYQSEPKHTHHAQRIEPYPYCQYNGDILKNPSDRCSYLECHYGEEPWYDKHGKAKLFARIRQCPQGTAIAKDSKQVIFRPIQYDPTKRIYKESEGYGDAHYSQKDYHKQPRYQYKNTYEDMTAICSEMVDGYTCKGY